MKEIFPGIFLETAYPPYNLVLIDTVRGAVAVDIPPRPVHAVNWLDRARRAYLAAGREADWLAYLAEIRGRHGRKYKLMGLLETFGQP